MKHLAIIMDGNRRWAKENKLKAFMGHKKGAEAARVAVQFCLENNIAHLSLYTFSLENFNRSEVEKNYIFNYIVEGIQKETPDFIKQGVQVRFVGDRTCFPSDMVSFIENIESQTNGLDNLHLNILFGYGAQQEITFAAKSIARKVKDGELDIEDINESIFSKYLWTANTPNPDLIIRTGGAMRLSNFLLYQAAYSELAFLNSYWPDITNFDLQKCVNEFKDTKRNFGA